MKCSVRETQGGNTVAVKIRLKRIGGKGKPKYRVIAIEERRRRDGEPLELLGYYDPEKNENTKLNMEHIHKWIKVGAIPSPTVQGLIKRSASSSSSSAE
jgi:small subunit ribosomal protein S16